MEFGEVSASASNSLKLEGKHFQVVDSYNLRFFSMEVSLTNHWLAYRYNDRVTICKQPLLGCDIGNSSLVRGKDPTKSDSQLIFSHRSTLNHQTPVGGMKWKERVEEVEAIPVSGPKLPGAVTLGGRAATTPILNSVSIAAAASVNLDQNRWENFTQKQIVLVEMLLICFFCGIHPRIAWCCWCW